MNVHNLKAKVVKYLLANPVNDESSDKYQEVRSKFNIDIKTASRYWIFVKSLLEANKGADAPINVKKILKQTGDNLDIVINTSEEIKTLEDLVRVCEVDSKVWQVVSWQCKKWDVSAKDSAGGIRVLFSVNAKFRPVIIEEDVVAQKELLLKELFTASPVSKTRFATKRTGNKLTSGNLLEIALFDVHFGKLAHREEVGEDYDLKIACERFKEAVSDLVSRVNISTVEKILLPIGQDLINIDNLQGTTTGGTPQDTDSRFHKIVKTVKSVLIETINELVEYAPVDVVISVGNHDEQTSFMIGEMLDAYYHNSEDVQVFNDASLRKYYQFGVNSIMFTHGNKERFNELGMVFAAENPQLWAATTQRFIQMGHFHHNKKVNNIQAQEFQGFQVQILPSLSGSDAWHKGKGYQSLKQAKAFLFNKDQGLVGEFTHTVK